MTFGVLLETFVARALLAPALLSLFGRYSAWPRKQAEPPVEAGLGAEVRPPEDQGTPSLHTSTGNP
jgi:uncharacterized membrane protein YdfJ with MMPL/SSD domain